MKTFILFLTLAAFAPLSAVAVPSAARLKSKLNQSIVSSDGSLFRMGDQLTNKKIQVMKVTYDATKKGATGESLGLQSNHLLKDVDGAYATIPSGALIKSAWIDITSTVRPANQVGRLCFQLQSNCDVKGAEVAQAYQTNGSTSFRQILPVNGSTVYRLTADRIVTAIVSGGTLTGGTMNLFIEYFLP